MEPNMEPNQNNASSKIVSALIIGLIVGFITGAFWQERRLSRPAISDTMATTEESDEGTALTDKVSGSSALSDNQSASVSKATVVTPPTSTDILAEIATGDQPAGDSVTVTVLNISEPVWIAVRDDVNGTLGNILGAHKAFTAGDAVITLLRPTISGTHYHVVMYKDVGDASFNYKEDVLLEKGQVVFKAE